jgi:hypothetical protein
MSLRPPALLWRRTMTPGTTLAASVSSPKFRLSSWVRVSTETDCGVSRAVSSILVAALA